LVVAALTVVAVTRSAPARGDSQDPNATSKVAAYWLVSSDGGIFAFGGASFYGSTGSIKLNQPIVGMAGTPTSNGYWLVASDGGIFAFGAAAFYGSTGSIKLNQPIVGMATTADGGGYWLVAADGGIFTFGDAQFYGSTGSIKLNKPIVGMAPTPDGGGYWLVASDGGIFAYGDAQFFGSTGSLKLNQPIVGMAAAPNGAGYWFTAADGGIFAFGHVNYFGSLGGVPQSRPIVGMSATPTGGGYWFTNNNGAVSAFGDATYWGSSPQVLNKPIVAIALSNGNGNFTGSSYPSGSFGYDISNFQCPPSSTLPPSPHTIGAVEVVGASMGSVNLCLAQEAAWAGAGLNLYVFLTYGTTNTTPDPACAAQANPSACNYGFNVALDAFNKAKNAGVNTSVAWWLDVEPTASPLPAWSGTTSDNASMVQGALDGLHSVGLNSVGIYASPGVWNNIVGNYAPAVPYWAASWQFDPAKTCTSVRSLFPNAKLPTGPVQLVQYSSPSYPYPLGGMSTLYDDDYAC
jgi:hypothetical protein